MPERITEHECVVCHEKIVEVTEREFDPTAGPLIIGPGGANQFQEKVSYHCGSCGLMYKFLPKKR